MKDWMVAPESGRIDAIVAEDGVTAPMADECCAEKLLHTVQAGGVCHTGPY